MKAPVPFQLSGANPPLPRDRISILLSSPASQAVSVALVILIIAAVHWQNDGLWFQGDAPRHAMNGLFWWDLLKAHPADPLMFTIRYYARYPVIAPATYPPLFYVLEGFAFSVFGSVPHVAKVLVLLFSGMAGLYTMAWARRWFGPIWGWAGAFLMVLPGVVLWSNAVMLNVPAMALCLASLYHFRRSLEDRDRTQVVLTIVALTGALLTYYQSASVVAVCVAWAVLLAPSQQRRSRRVLYGAMAAAAAAVPLVISMSLAPIQLARHLPSFRTLSQVNTWTFYWRTLPDLVGPVGLGIAAVALVLAVWTARTRREIVYLGTWVAVLIVGFSLLPAKDPRYLILVLPALVLGVALGLVGLAERLPTPRPNRQAVGIALGLAIGIWSAAFVRIPTVSGFREVALYLQQHAPTDAVLYDGVYDGVFGFYVRSLDPRFERRIAPAAKLLYAYGPTTTFRPIEQSKVNSATDVENLIRTKSGSRWVAVEVGGNGERLMAQRLLRRALLSPGFELVRSFPVHASGTERVDLYRVLGPVTIGQGIDLAFPAFSTRVFEQVAPITR